MEIPGSLKILVPVKFRPKLKTVYSKVRFFGLRYKCPLCNSWIRTFLPYGLNFPVLKEKAVVGGGYRLNALCPICTSVDRERLLYLYLLYKTDIFTKPQKLLHVAPEERIKDILSCLDLDYVTADLLRQDVMVKTNITDIRYLDGSFDVIICNHVLEHVADDRKAMSELYRILRPGGWAILQVPISLVLEKTLEDFSITTAKDRELAFGQDDHVRIYAKDYVDRLEQAGFTVEIFNWLSEARDFGGPRNVFGLNKDECVYLAKKPIADRQRLRFDEVAVDP